MLGGERKRERGSADNMALGVTLLAVLNNFLPQLTAAY